MFVNFFVQLMLVYNHHHRRFDLEYRPLDQLRDHYTSRTWLHLSKEANHKPHNIDMMTTKKWFGRELTLETSKVI